MQPSKINNVSGRLGGKRLGIPFHEPRGRLPQEQVAPEIEEFSLLDLSQVHWPAGRARHEQRGPETAFSRDALLHVQ